MGITSTADSFGPTTISKFNAKYPNGIQQQADNSIYEDNVYAIIQGALWCKGYSTGAAEITKHFYGGTGSGVMKLKSDAGVDASTSIVMLDVMQALLSMNQYVNLWRQGGSSEIRSIQQDINRNYRAYVGLSPCDGLYSRDMNKALIKVLQAVEGLSIETATGSFGETTTRECPILPNGAYVTEGNRAAAIKLLRYALCCNGYSTGSVSGEWDNSLVDTIKDFQNAYVIPETGIADLNTWMALMISKGNPDRPAVGCDCSTILNITKAEALYSAGYRYVGRYLTGTVGEISAPKNLSKSEMNAIFNSGLRIFTIYQDNSPSVGYYTKAQGEADAALAIVAAQKMGIPYYEVIYFAVDYDMMDYQITSNVIPYFEGIFSTIRSKRNMYRIGVYGSRNVCIRVSSRGLAVSSFVSDMSTGFSGNMGYPMPFNWAFDQFKEFMFSGGDASFALDNDAYSGKYPGFSTLEDHREDDIIEVPTEEIYLERFTYLLSLMHINVSGDLTLNKKYTFNIGNVKVEYEAGIKAPFEEKEGCRYAAIMVTNGKVSDEEVSATLDLYNKLSTEVKAEIDDSGTLKYSVDFEKEIENGTVKYGLGFTVAGELVIDYNIEELLWKENDTGTEFKLYTNITFTIEPTTELEDDFQKIRIKIPEMLEEDIRSIARISLNTIEKNIEWTILIVGILGAVCLVLVY